MPVVSNTTPLRHLIAIDQERLLPELFAEITVPRAVHEELTHARTPPKIVRFLQSPPDWYRIHETPPTHEHPFSFPLDRGEREAILLAEFLHARVLLIDDQLGRVAALSRNLVISGTLGVLEDADEKGLLRDFPQILIALKASGFFLGASLERELLARHRARHASH